MPPRNNSSNPPLRGQSPLRRGDGPPKVMTWPRATPALAIAGLSDILKLFFNGFWFFGPAIASAYCTSKVSGLVGSAWGLTDAACTAAAVAGGAYFSPIIAAVGVIMADAVAFIGFLALVLWFLATNLRILKTVRTAMMQVVASFGFGAIPLVGAIPSFTPTVYKLYRRQIKLEKAALKKWEEENTVLLQQQRNRQLAQAAQIQAARQAQFMQQEAANEAVYAQAANDAQDEIPEDEELAA